MAVARALATGRGDLGPGRLVGHTDAVDPQQLPRLARPGRAQIWAAVLLAAADDRRRDAPGPVPPAVRSRPAARAHQVVQRLADGRWRARRRLRPPEPARPGVQHGHEHEPGPELRNLVLAGLHNVPPGLVAKRVQALEHLGPVAVEAVGCQALDVLQQYRARAGFPD